MLDKTKIRGSSSRVGAVRLATLVGASALLIAAGTAVAAKGRGNSNSPSTPTTTAGSTQTNDKPEAADVVLAGVVRDFRAANTSNGHPDFEVVPPEGRGVYRDITEDTLNAQGDPVFRTSGFKVTQQARDAQQRPIIGAKPHVESRPGDQPASASLSQGGAVASAASFADWYRDNPLVNISAPFSIPLSKQGDALVFDGDLRTQFANVGGFGGNKVFGYTFETECLILRNFDAPQILTFGADDCLWVYIDGKLVLDLGGNHDYVEQTIDLSRLAWLKDKTLYTMKVFYAERDKGASRFRMTSTAALRRVETPAVTGLWD